MDRIERKMSGGLDEVNEGIVKVIQGTKGGWAYWDQLSSREKAKLKRGIKEVVLEGIFRKGFKEMLARVMFDEKGFPIFDSEVFKWIKERWFGGKLDEMMRVVGKWREGKGNKGEGNELLS